MKKLDTIFTKRLRIVPFNEEFLTKRYVSWLNDPVVVRFSEQRHHVNTMESCKQYWQSFIDTPNYLWALVLRGSVPTHIGNMNAYVDLANKVADVGILIGERSFWNQGFGMEAWAAVCNYLLNEVKIRKVTGGALAANLGMLAIMKNSGMVEDGRRSRHYLFEDGETDAIYFALFKDTQPATQV